MTTLDQVNDWCNKGTIDPEIRAGIVAMLDRLGELCDDHLACESCDAVICESCEINTLSPCDHFTICVGCYDDHYCRTCVDDDRRWAQADIDRANAKEGN